MLQLVSASRQIFSSRLRSVDRHGVKLSQAFRKCNMTYRRLVLLPEAALDAPLDDYGSNLKVHHSSGEVIGRMFRPTGSDGDAFAKLAQAFQLPTWWDRRMAQKLGPAAHFPFDESRSPAARPAAGSSSHFGLYFFALYIASTSTKLIHW